MTIDNCQFCHTLSQFVTRTVFKRQIQTFWESGPEILCYTGLRCAVFATTQFKLSEFNATIYLYDS